jgi:AcrR family transcriptional regulator
MAMRLPASSSAITVDSSTTILYQLVESTMSTRDRIIEDALTLFGTRGVDAVSLDEIARSVGVRKQTVLYWFESKDDLVEEVLAVAAAELVVTIEAALRAAPADPLDRIDAVVRAVFRPAVRRPALLGLVREVSRLDAAQSARLRERLRPLVDRAVGFLEAEMAAGRIRAGDPRLVAALGYATVTGIATEPEALRAVDWRADAVGLRRLRDELRAYLRAALTP